MTNIPNDFRVFAHGAAFDADAYLTVTTLQPDYVWRKGDQRRYACVESKHLTSGVEIVLGNGLVVPSLEQERIALNYLQAHRTELQALATFPGVETFILGLQYICKLDEGLVGFALRVSADLMREAVAIDIEPTHYVHLQRSRETEQTDE
jgi:hypothetical protein